MDNFLDKAAATNTIPSIIVRIAKPNKNQAKILMASLVPLANEEASYKSPL